MRKIICDICENEISLNQFKRHYKSRRCLSKIKRHICECGKEFDLGNSIGGHKVFCHTNPNRDRTRKKLSKIFSGRKLTEKHKRKISEGMQIAVRKYPESYSANNVCGRTKLIETIDLNDNVVLVNGRWEYEVSRFFNRNRINWTNKVKGFPYRWREKQRIYYPDFYLIDWNLFVEVKGYERERDIKNGNL